MKGRGTWWLIVVVLAALGWPGAVRAEGIAPEPLDWAIPGGHFYTQANGFPPGTSPMGYSIVDDDQARFWTAFQKGGGVARFGYPASQRFWWGGFLSQVTQKTVLQWRPETASVDYVNVFDDLDRVGKDAWLQTTRSIPPPVPATFDAGLDWNGVMRHRLDLLKTRPALFAAYQSTPDAIDQFGLPTSPVVDAGPMFVVRLQRAVLQEWKIKEPWADVGQVTIANGGDLAKEAGALPPNALRPIAPPNGTWLATSGGYVLDGHATWYEPGFVGKPMRNGQIYDPEDPTTTACNAFPLGSHLQVTSPLTHKTIQLVVRDTGDFVYPDVLDLSPAAFVSLGIPTPVGVTPVEVVLLDGAPTSSKTQAPPAP